MKLAPFLLDQWLEQKFAADPPIEFDLGSSTGPMWTLGELLALRGGIEHLLDTPLFYTPPAGSDELRQELARMENVDPAHVLVTTGAAEALLILLHRAAEPGANVVLPNPGFPTNEAVAESLGLHVRRYNLRAENGFHIDPREIRSQIDSRTKFVLINSPHNPTGAVIPDSMLETLHDECLDRGVQLVCDEVYHPIYHGPAMRSAARLPGVTVISDFSKALCLSGLRIGWMIERDAHRREACLNARSYFTVSSSVISERLAALAIRHRAAIYDRARRIAQANLQLLEYLFSRHEGLIEWIRPAGGMTAFPRLAGGADARDFCKAVARSGVLLVPGDCFGAPQHFRIGFAASGEAFPRAIERLAAALEAVSTARANVA